METKALALLMDISTWTDFKQKTWNYIVDPANWTVWLIIAVKVLIIYIGGRIANAITRRAVSHMVQEREKSPLKFDQRRTKTIGRLVGNLISYTINFFVIILVLSQFGFNLAPILAGAGVLGLAIGFGAQSLVKDVITGFFIIFEDQFAVGDVVQTGNFKGTVEEIGIRVTRIRSWTGEIHIIPNGLITQVTNFSTHNSLAVVDVTVAYEADLAKALAVTKETVHRVYESCDAIVKEPSVLGVQAVTSAEVTIRVTAECRPNGQGEAMRVLNLELMQALNEHGLKKIG
ncbi:mechanosensitive ion channel family protein [Paenibacillus flagellatus]|uniref:Mechanosensitive ion channel protein MscS n=1 Tax=Paenibacillus flagellatus TaxID=2211139 RepID=A0A2V5JZN3_9BACL|nr:mechanosensitive ion channel family protein [Paenibacillus flagellatus]PYI52395.1 mechanosensitive ion channel protein MscS [Paenibacillus flagellatus]